jgi:hypothetical protein
MIPCILGQYAVLDQTGIVSYCYLFTLLKEDIKTPDM